VIRGSITYPKFDTGRRTKSLQGKRSNLLLILGGCLLVFYAFLGSGATLTVDINGKIKSVKQAIQLANAGDTILVMPGTYREGNLLVQKSLTILGRNFPVLDGEGKYEIFTVTANHVTISGFRLVDTGRASINDLAAVKGLDVTRLRVINNKFENAFFGIHLSNSNNCTVEGNTLAGGSGVNVEHDTGNGIHFWKCDHMTVRRNVIERHRDGIYFEFVTKSIVDENLSQGNLRYGLHFMFSHDDDYINNTFRNNGSGAAVMYTKGVKMIGNRFEDNWGSATYALLLKDIGDSRIEKCVFIRNTVAIYMEGSSRIMIQENEFRQNGWAMKIQASCDDNVITRNNFVANTFDISTNGSISLNSITRNYWDRYEGYDLNRDGVGDVPFHPVSLYGMIVEKMPTAVMLWRSFLVFLLDRTERVLPVVTPENLKDDFPAMKLL